MTDLILVEKPEALNIPCLALSREPQSYIQRLNLASELDGEEPDPRRLFGGNIAAWIRQHQTTKGPVLRAEAGE
jgi:hypothetical protein